MDLSQSAPVPSSQPLNAIQGSSNVGDSIAHTSPIKQRGLQGQGTPVSQHISHASSSTANCSNEQDTDHAINQAPNLAAGPSYRPQTPAAESPVWAQKLLLSLGLTHIPQCIKRKPNILTQMAVVFEAILHCSYFKSS
jgi:hypothetical protein